MLRATFLIMTCLLCLAFLPRYLVVPPVIDAKHVSAGRVKQMKGLTHDPICSVEDNQARPRPMSALTNRDLGSGYRPPGSSRYSANTNKHLYAVGVGVEHYYWRMS